MNEHLPFYFTAKFFYYIKNKTGVKRANNSKIWELDLWSTLFFQLDD